MKYNAPEIKDFVKMCADIYGYDSISYAGNKKHSTFVDDVNFPFCVSREASTLYVVFSGTDKLQDWMTNVNILLTEENYLKGRVHTGFWEEYQAIKGKLFMLLSDYLTPDISKIFIGGHSAGGALSTLFATDLLKNILSEHQNRLKPEVILVTCGSPRVGDKEFADYANDLIGKENIFSFVNSNDSVTRLPFVFGLYKHVGNPYYFNRKGKLLIRPSIWIRIWNQIVDRFWNQNLLSGINNHSVEQYYQVLSKHK